MTPQEDLGSGAMALTSLTAAMKDLGSIKEHLGSWLYLCSSQVEIDRFDGSSRSLGAIHAGAANAEVLRHLATLQDSWAARQRSERRCPSRRSK